MRRREFITLLGGASATWPLAARAQQQAERVRRIGMLETVSPALNAAQLDAFRKGLRELGYVEGQTDAMGYRSADGYANRFPIGGRVGPARVDLIVVRGTPCRDRRRADKRACSDHFANCAVCQYEQRGCSATMGRDENGGTVLGYRGRAGPAL
jgi:hypothetical protein